MLYEIQVQLSFVCFCFCAHDHCVFDWQGSGTALSGMTKHVANTTERMMECGTSTAGRCLAVSITQIANSAASEFVWRGVTAIHGNLKYDEKYNMYCTMTTDALLHHFLCLFNVETSRRFLESTRILKGERGATKRQWRCIHFFFVQMCSSRNYMEDVDDESKWFIMYELSRTQSYKQGQFKPRSWPTPIWLHDSMVGPSHQYHRGHGFDFSEVPVTLTTSQVAS